MLVKIFERTWVIRFFGIALILAPFFNTANSVLELSGIEKKFLIFYCWQFFKSAPLPQQLLQTASVIIGVIMLRGAVSAWKFALALLGAYIILQFTQLNANMRDNWNWIYLAVNVLVFFFIADQIVFKPRAPRPVQPAPKPAMPVAPAPAMELVATSGGEVFVPKMQTVTPAPEQSIADAVKEVSDKLKAEAAQAARESEKLKSELERMKLEQAEQLKAEIERLRMEKEKALAQQAAELAAQQAEFAAFKAQAEAKAFAEAQARAQAEAQAAQARTAQAAMPQTELQASSTKKVFIDFEGFGNWATITDVSNAGIRVRAIAPAPPEIQSRIVELDLDSHLSVKLKFFQQDGANYFFKFVNLSNADKLSINRWLINLAS